MSETPGFREEQYKEMSYQSDQVFTSTLHFPTPTEFGNGALVVRLEVDTKEEVRWQEEVRFGSKYKYYHQPPDWRERHGRRRSHEVVKWRTLGVYKM